MNIYHCHNSIKIQITHTSFQPFFGIYLSISTLSTVFELNLRRDHDSTTNYGQSQIAIKVLVFRQYPLEDCQCSHHVKHVKNLSFCPGATQNGPDFFYTRHKTSTQKMLSNKACKIECKKKNCYVQNISLYFNHFQCDLGMYNN